MEWALRQGSAIDLFMDSMNARSMLIFHLLSLSVLCGLLFFSYLGAVPFFNKGEPREAVVVQDIFLHGNWLFPLKGGTEVPSKPPLFHWFGGFASIAWGQVTEATVRFPSALFATLGIFTLYFFGRRIFAPRVAFLGGIILATTGVYLIQAVSARVDMTLSFFISLTLVYFYLLYQNFFSGRIGYYGFYLLLGVGVLAKGPVGLIIPALVIGSFLGLRKRWDIFSRLFFHEGALLTVAVVVSWYGLALVRGGEDFISRQVIHENLARFFVYGEGGTGHVKPFYFYLPHLFLEGLPWSLFLPLVVIDWVRGSSFSEDGSLFLMLWIGATFLFFSLAAGKRPVYLLPLYFPLALLTAAWLRERPAPGRAGGFGLWCVGLIALLGCGIIGLVLFDVVSGPGPLTLFLRMASGLRPQDQAGFLLFWDVLERGSWFSTLFLLGLALPWTLLTWDLLRGRWQRVPIQLAGSVVIAWLFAQGGLVSSLAETMSYRPFMKEVNRLVPNGKLYLYPGFFDPNPVLFYRGSSIPAREEPPQVLAEWLHSSDVYVIMAEEAWRRIKLTDADFPAPLFKSKGGGPKGNVPLVVIQGKNFLGVHR